MTRKRFCYFHTKWRQAAAPKSGSRGRRAAGQTGQGQGPAESLQMAALELPPLEDANSIQVALMQVMRLILTRQIDGKLAGLLLYALQTATSNLKQLTLEPDWKKVVVNPGAVRYSPLDTTSDTLQDLEQENELLFQRAQKGPSAEELAEKSGQKPRPCATAAAAISAVLRSRHPLPTSPEDWDELKEKDISAWLMAMAALNFPKEKWEQIRAHPEEWQEDDRQEEPAKQ